MCVHVCMREREIERERVIAGSADVVSSCFEAAAGVSECASVRMCV